MVGERQVVNLQDIGIADVPVFGRYWYTSTHPGLRTHCHPHCLEICYLKSGRQTYRVGTDILTVSGGEVLVVMPGERHDTAGRLEERGALYWLNLLLPKPGGSLLMLPPNDSRLLMAQLCTLPRRKFPGNLALKQIFDKVFSIYDQPKHPLKRVVILNLLVQCLLEVLDCAKTHERSHDSSVIAQIAARIQAEPHLDWSLADLANQAGVSLSRFKVKFKNEVGTGPHEYILRTKIEAAEQMLLNGKTSITEVAMALGFSSSQHFATTFKRFTCQTPHDFRAQARVAPLRADPVPVTKWY